MNSLRTTHWVWWAVVFACGLVFIFALPPYRSNDEYPHWVRTMSVAQGSIRAVASPRR